MFEPIPIQERTLIQRVKSFDDNIFNGHQQISLHELETIAQQHGLFAIFKDGEIIAEAQILFNSTNFYTLEDSNWAFIYGLGVDVKYRKKGLATQMLSFLENLAIYKEKTSIYLATRPDNDKAIELWHRAGYREYAYKPNFFGANKAKDARLLFKKNLKL